MSRQNSNENENFSVARPAQFATRDRPENDEDGLEIEYDEEHRGQIELDGQAHLHGTFGNNAGLIRRTCGGFLMALAQNIREASMAATIRMTAAK